MNKIFFIFIFGWLILAGAIFLNWLAAFWGISTWYDFLKNPKETEITSLGWLFVFYPFFLGVVAYFSAKILNIF